jgi:hypothetical protein
VDRDVGWKRAQSGDLGPQTLYPPLIVLNKQEEERHAAQPGKRRMREQCIQHDQW